MCFITIYLNSMQNISLYVFLTISHLTQKLVIRWFVRTNTLFIMNLNSLKALNNHRHFHQKILHTPSECELVTKTTNLNIAIC